MADAYDNAAVNLVTTTTTNAVTFTVTGNLIIASVFNTSGDTISSMTAIKGGTPTAMTLLAKRAGLTGEEMYTYGMLNPDTGSNTVTATFSSGNISRLHVESLSGVDTGTPVSSYVTASGTNTSSSSGTGTLTTTVDNSWTYLFVRGNNNLSAGTGSTERPSAQNTTSTQFDSNGPIHPAGSTNMSYSLTAAQNSWIMVAIPPAGGAAPTIHSLSSLGAGT